MKTKSSGTDVCYIIYNRAKVVRMVRAMVNNMTGVKIR